MGGSESVPEVGYHVLQVSENSPGARAGLVSYFDFIIGANSQPLNSEDARLVEILRDNISDEVKLQVYNSRDGSIRETRLVPSNTWGGAGFAGISVRFCSLAQANEHVWHVLQVHPSSPAEAAGLNSYTDYIVGTPDLLFNDKEDFFALVRAKEGSPITLYVYSTLTDNVRLVTIVPNKNWGESGSLGCNVGYGYLHRIPSKGSPASSPNKATVVRSLSGNPKVLNERGFRIPSTLSDLNDDDPLEEVTPFRQPSNVF
eukprot:TRINITY_DN5488_c0_g1_i1.p1 TRINITY_DN5488_c0_g1~~TRINITY_DN5488_c0_g1_i1.p1  ORF type:complete len:258 (-),score=47.56 TRINITY_DN5488_c0_g1_i1:149-922(-)